MDADTRRSVLRPLISGILIEKSTFIINRRLSTVKSPAGKKGFYKKSLARQCKDA
jgi:hypothetical protein